MSSRSASLVSRVFRETAEKPCLKGGRQDRTTVMSTLRRLKQMTASSLNPAWALSVNGAHLQSQHSEPWFGGGGERKRKKKAALVLLKQAWAIQQDFKKKKNKQNTNNNNKNLHIRYHWGDGGSRQIYTNSIVFVTKLTALEE